MAIALLTLAAPLSAKPRTPAASRVPATVAAAARAIALAGARPASLTTPMRGVRRERFAGGWMWVIDGGRMGDSSLCGTGGCDVQFWLRRPDGRYARSFDQRVLRYTLAGRTSPAPLLHVEYHGSHCGQPGNAECPMQYRWSRNSDGSSGRFMVRPAGGQGILPGPLLAAVPPDPARIPEPVAAAQAMLTDQCRALGGRYAANPGELPDLDGDGRADWVTGGEAYACVRGDDVIERACAGAACPMTIFATNGGVRPVYAVTGKRYLVSWQASGTRLLIAPQDQESAEQPRILVFEKEGGSAVLAP